MMECEITINSQIKRLACQTCNYTNSKDTLFFGGDRLGAIKLIYNMYIVGEKEPYKWAFASLNQEKKTLFFILVETSHYQDNEIISQKKKE